MHVNTFEYAYLTDMCFLYLDVSDELQSRGLYRGLAVYDSLYGSCPPHGLVQHLGVEAVGMLPPVDDDVPVTCQNSNHILQLK